MCTAFSMGNVMFACLMSTEEGCGDEAMMHPEKLRPLHLPKFRLRVGKSPPFQGPYVVR